jgi:replicative DNA helicase
LSHLDSKLLQEALSFVDETWFYSENRKVIYSSIVQVALEASVENGLRIKKEKVAAVARSLTSEASAWARHCIEDCLGAEKETVLSIDSLQEICISQWRIVKAKPAVEMLLLEADNLLAARNRREDLPVQVESILHEAAETWSNSIHQVNKKGEVTESQFVDELLTPIDDSNPTVAPSSIEAFDSHLLGGAAINSNTICGKLITIAARPGVGKTAAAASIVKGIAKNGYKSVFYTLEVPKRQMLQRLLCIHDFEHQLEKTGQLVNCIRVNQFARKSFSADQLDRIENYRGHISKNIQIFDSFREVDQISAHLTMLKKRDPSIAIACVDHLGLLKLRNTENTAYAIGELTRKLKELAVNLSMDIILMCQLNREVEKRNNKRPVLSDLRDSGRIEEDSDTVIGLYRDIENGSQEFEFIALKNRHNALGTTKCTFYLQYGTVK